MKIEKGLLGAFLGIVIFFSIPQLFLWAQVDHFETPVRSYEGDTLHYLGIVNRTVADGAPRTQAYFKEQSANPPQFIVFQGALAFLSPVLSVISITWLALLLQLCVALGVFWCLRFLLIKTGVPSLVALVVSLSVVLVSGPIAFRGYALGNWFLPLALLGVVFLVKFWESEKLSRRSLGYSFLALLAFSLHPIYYTLGGAALGFLWIARLRREPTAVSWKLFGVWFVAALGLFLVLFGRFLVGTPEGADTLARIVSIKTRLPFHALFMIRLLFLSGAGYFLSVPVVAATALASFLGLSSYIGTGTYIANDHYAILEDYLVLVLSLGVLFRKESLRKIPRWFSWVAVALAGITAYDIFQYLEFRPGYLGRYAPLIAGYILLAIILVLPQYRKKIAATLSLKSTLGVLVAFSVLYGFAITYLDMKPEIQLHRAEQEYRPLLSFFESKNEEAILADPGISDFLSVYSPGYVYWSPIGFSETVSNTELYRRWFDARLFFGAVEGLEPVRVTGTTDRCYEYKRVVYLELLAKLGYSKPKETLCDLVDVREASFELMEKQYEVESGEVLESKTWDLGYGVDWLVIDRVKDTPPPEWLAEKYFTLETILADRFVVYRKN